MMNKQHMWMSICLLILSIGFSLWLYRMEPTAMIDPNDNAFQYALVDRTNQIWEFARQSCPTTILYPVCHFSYLTDHWVPNWAEGYNLPYYYSHIPQIAIVASYRLFHLPISLFQYYHIVIYFILSLFPLSLFIAVRILNYSWITAGSAAVLASLISTDGLYGIDQTSFLWRGWGLSSQLFALFWLPLAIASAVRVFTKQAKAAHQKTVLMTICLLVLTTMGHVGIGMMAFLGIGCIACSNALYLFLTHHPIKHVMRAFVSGIWKTLVVAVPAIILLSYWIVPAFLHNTFHNISLWDPVWKFNSFGIVEVVTKLVNGDLFDFGRFPVYTALIIVGVIASTHTNKTTKTQEDMPSAWPFSMLFLFFLLLFCGTTTWGSILSLIPGMSEFHGHRFLVGVHLAGLFLAPLGLTYLIDKGKQWTAWTHLHADLRSSILFIVTLSGAAWLLLPHIVSYATYNNTLISQANDAYRNVQEDTDLLRTTLMSLQQENPGRVYALRGTEGKEFRIASTPYYMYLSTVGIPTVLWLPETWSLNSDTEQFFSEDTLSHYALYNIQYVVTPKTKTPQPFWTPIKETPSWILYTVNSPPSTTHKSYMAIGSAPTQVFANKQHIINLMHLYIQSTYPRQSVYPELILTNTNPTNTPHPTLFQFSLTDLVTYQTPDLTRHNLFHEQPVYPIPSTPLPMKITNTKENMDMVFSTHVDVSGPCTSCVVIVKQTYHPNWRVTVNGVSTIPISVFPSFTAVRIEQPGSYDIVFSYTPGRIKQICWISAVFMIVAVFLYTKRNKIS